MAKLSSTTRLGVKILMAQVAEKLSAVSKVALSAEVVAAWQRDELFRQADSRQGMPLPGVGLSEQFIPLLPQLPRPLETFICCRHNGFRAPSHPIRIMGSQLLNIEEFYRRLSGLSPVRQLDLCHEIFRGCSLAQRQWHQLVFNAWQWVEAHQLYRFLKKDSPEYWKHIDDQYAISPIVDEVKRKNDLRSQIENCWHASVEQCLGPLCPPNPSRNLLENLLSLAQCCPDIVIAKHILGLSKECRPLRSRLNVCIIASDVERAVQHCQSQQLPALLNDSHQNRNLPLPEQAASGPKICRPNPRASSQKLQKRKRNAKQHGHTKSRNRKSPPQSPASFQEESSSDSEPEPGSPNSTVLSNTSTAESTEDQEYQRILRQFAPYRTTDMMTRLIRELDRQEKEISQRPDAILGEIWGEYNIRRIRKVLRVAKPANLYIEDTPPGIRVGIYQTASREDADVLCLNSDLAAKVLAEGPSDGKPVFTRHRGEYRSLTAEDLVSHIERFRVEDVEVQDPCVLTDKDFLQRMSPTDITEKLRNLLDSKMTTGYGEHQIPPFNLLSLPKISSRTADCLSRLESTQIYARLRQMNHAPGSPAPESDSGTVLSTHLALALTHVDGNGLGLNGKTLFGYKIWVSWPECLGERRAEFNRKGNEFHGRGARYILLAPGDEYTQTPCVSQDIHSVVTIGYCGVAHCSGDCTLNGQPKCCGLAALDYQSYWSEQFMSDSLQSIIDSVECKRISSEEPSLDLENLLHHIEVLMKRNETLLGSPEARQRFLEKKAEYLRKSRKR